MIERRLASGRYRLVHRGVYRLTAAPFTDLARLLAAVLACGPSALASHRAAAWLWGLVDKPCVEVSIDHERAGSAVAGAAGVVLHRIREPGAPSVRHGIPVTNPLRTMFDLAGVLRNAPPDDDSLALAFDRGVASRLFTPTAVRAELARVREHGKPGGPALELMLDGCGPISMRSPSVVQNALARLIHRAGLPDPVAEHEVLGGSYRIDLAYPDLYVGLEVDGFEFHGGPRQAARDHARRRRLAALGWTILVFTPEDVWQRPAAVVAEIRREVIRRASLPA
ncbi:MAG: hypothetical protein QOK43_2861 [Acidimicrobiaceae bacterium]|nr:hypothetical protein [Acidimicrobiaceae bacterium]